MPKQISSLKVMLDRERILLLDLNAMVAFEDKTGKSMINSRTWDNDLTARDIRALLWACLIHEDENLTLEEVGKMIRSDNMDVITQALFEAWGMAMPEKEEGKTAENPLI